MKHPRRNPLCLPLLLAVFLQLGGCTTMRECDPELAKAAAGQSTPPNACQVDGCTLVPDFNFSHCCNNHDVRYWAGGSATERKAADLEFWSCIRAADHQVLADIYYYGVRLAGTPYLPTPWRWGFGWDFPHKYSGESIKPEPK